MGKKGGGRSGFMKQARKGLGDPDVADTLGVENSNTSKEIKKEFEPEVVKCHPYAISSKAAAFLKEGDSTESGDSGPDSNKSAESRGQMLQRHKRELKTLKENIKRLGKRGKEEGVKLEEEMAARHDAELESLLNEDLPAATCAALPNSLYNLSLADNGLKKPSKAQLRREKIARDEAERNARIAAELAELGETERVREERQLGELLEPLGYQIRDIPPDGHCLYRSVEDQLKTVCPSVAEIEGLDFGSLRKLAASTMRANVEHYRPFLLDEDLAENGEEGDAFENYCNAVADSAAWGGHMEVQALSAALKVTIIVYTAGSPEIVVGEDTGGERTLRICYLRHAYGLGEHYNSVARKMETEERPLNA